MFTASFDSKQLQATPDRYRQEAARYAALRESRTGSSSAREYFAHALRWLAEALEPNPTPIAYVPRRNES